MRAAVTMAVMVVFLTGCKTEEQGGDCKSLIEKVCDLCAVPRHYDDTVCACIVDGSISRPQDYFNDARDAQVYCQNQKNQVDPELVSPETEAECAQDYALINKFKGDACETLGFSGGQSYRDTGFR